MSAWYPTCMSSIASDLVKWAEGRPGWQRRVLSRLAQGETLGAADHRAIAERLAASDDDPQATFTLAAAAGRETSDAVGLVEIAQTANVNALAAGETLTFAPTGLTVVYGDNGSGKSGYARLIKQISRARVTEQVLPDIFATSTDSSPRAEVGISLHGEEAIRCQWTDVPPAASRIGFFDESCGEAFLTKESEVTYRPAELNLFDGLSRACDGVRAELDRLLGENENRATTLPSVSPDGQAARFLRELSPSTTDDEIARACRVAADVDAEIEALERQAHTLQASGPCARTRTPGGFCERPQRTRESPDVSRQRPQPRRDHRARRKEGESRAVASSCHDRRARILRRSASSRSRLRNVARALGSCSQLLGNGRLSGRYVPAPRRRLEVCALPSGSI